MRVPSVAEQPEATCAQLRKSSCHLRIVSGIVALGGAAAESIG